ncbi:MAG: gamma-glutamyltransferase, partial [Gammaproteobacteria bacterium]|nr:gamma-glutamyltransferase [Gammaproteobacteria bacterium]
MLTNISRFWLKATPLLLALIWTSACAQTAKQAGIATAHPIATEAGHEILQAGGNAFDAAVAITATLAVVEPMSSGLGGGGFWLLHRQQDAMQVFVDGRETAPGKAHRDMYLDKDGNVIPNLSMDGPLSAGIPGLPAAMAHIAQKYGKLPLSQSLQPAIRAAKNGFPVRTYYTRVAQFRLKALQDSPAAAKIFLNNNEVPPEGHIIKQTDLANTLQALADQGAAGFYQGAVAQKLVQGVQQAKGIWTLEDLAKYTVVERQPVQGQYQGLKITTAPPPSSGGIAMLTTLNILAPYPLAKLPRSEQVHLTVEAMRRAYRDRAIYLGDPDFVEIPQETLLHPFYADGLRAAIREDQATPSNTLPGLPAGKGRDTTHFSVLDQDGNRVSATLTINYPFGSGFVPPGTGVLLNDEMDDFSAKPGVPNAYGLVGGEANAIAAGKRPLSSMSPTFIESDRGVAILGTPGGSRIISMVLLAILDYAQGGNALSMVSLPRYHHQYLPDQIQHEENTFTPTEIQALKTKGHEFKQVPWPYGNMQAVLWEQKDN